MAFIFGPLPLPGLASITLVRENRVLALRPEHPLAGRDAVGPAELADLPWLRVPADPGPLPAFR